MMRDLRINVEHVVALDLQGRRSRLSLPQGVPNVVLWKQRWPVPGKTSYRRPQLVLNGGEQQAAAFSPVFRNRIDEDSSSILPVVEGTAQSHVWYWRSSDTTRATLRIRVLGHLALLSCLVLNETYVAFIPTSNLITSQETVYDVIELASVCCTATLL